MPALVFALGLAGTSCDSPEAPARPFAKTAVERSGAALTEAERPASRAERLGLGTFDAASLLLSGRPDDAWVEAAATTAPPPSVLRWPVPTGWLGRGFGSGEDGNHKAVDVAGDRGDAVLAAAAGIVGYASNEVRGYGNLVLLVHPQGWVTLYAHNQANLVVPGERVEAGETIARVGNTGRSRGPHLHFELLVAGRKCDPAPLFRPLARRRSGLAVAPRPLRWDAEADKPPGIVCQPG